MWNILLRDFWIIVICLLSLFSSSIKAELISREKLVEDSRQLLNLVETVHPQPYFSGGGKILFHKRYQNILANISDKGMSRNDFRGLLSPFLAAVGDGHTYVYPDGPSDFSGIPLIFYVVEDNLYISGVLDEKYKPLLGAKLKSVEGINLKELIQRTRNYYGSDNIYGTLSLLGNFEHFLTRKEVLEDIVPEWIEKSQINVSLIMPDGSEQHINFPVFPRSNPKFFRPQPGIKLPTLNGLEFGWGFVNNQKDIAYLKIKRMIKNRETYEKRSTYSDISDEAHSFYQDIYNKAYSSEPSEILNNLPSLTETYIDLVKQMKNAKTSSLIIDLRTNTGGWALASDMLIYFLYGKEKLIELHRSTNIAVRKLSEHYFKSEPEMTLDGINKIAKTNNQRNFDLMKNDYDFSDIENLEGNLLSREYAKKIVVEDLKLTPTFYSEFKAGNYSNYYLPKTVLVLTNAATFSSGFTFAKSLELSGAYILGVNSSQNIIQMGETFSFKLSNSGLTGSISRTQLTHDSQLNYTDLDSRVFKPDITMTYDKLKQYKFSKEAEISYAIDLLLNTSDLQLNIKNTENK